MPISEPLVETLTAREIEIINLLGANLSNEEIAAKLNLAVSTVKWYTGQIFSKLGVGNRRQAAAQARALGLLTAPASAAAGSRPDEADEPILPTGMVTFLFTDIAGSTPLWERLPDEMKVALAQHHAILRLAIEAHGGHVYQVVGDSFQASFRLASSALAAALAAQAELQTTEWGLTGPLRVRMGLHTGPAEVDRLGNAPYEVSHTLNRAARVMSAAHGGQILLTEETATLVDHELPERVSLQDLGEFHLKGMQRQEHLFQVTAPGLPHDFSAPKAISASHNNLPVQTTSFIGREVEIGKVAQLLEQHRLVTLTGSGGTGKTRLSLQVAADILHRYTHGVWLVALAPLTDPDKIPYAVATALGLQVSGETSTLDLLDDYLKPRRLLLVLDNCEHLIEACAALVEHLLHACPDLTVLASSREALGIAGEASYHVPSLDIPATGQAATLEAVGNCEAVCLFIDRARLLETGFTLTEENSAAVAEICRRLDGIPLAIELAAARVTMLSAEQIAARLNDRFRLLTGGSRTALPRQQTLRASIDWSYSQLSPLERNLLQRLAVFAGGWTLEAAEAVCGQDGLDEYAVLDGLASLVKKSLVVFTPTALPDPRYRLLETIRQYAREKLLDDGGGDELRRRHQQYFRRLVEQVKDGREGPQQRLWLDRFAMELENVRAALEWGLADPPIDSFLNGLELISQLRWLEIEMDGREAYDWLQRYLTHPEYARQIPLGLRAQAVYTSAVFLWDQAQIQASHQAALQSLALAKEVGEQQLELESLLILSHLAQWVREGPSAGEYYQLALDFAHQTGIYEQNERGLLFFQGNYSMDNDPALAKRCFEGALALDRQRGNQIQANVAMRNLGDLASRMGDFQKAEQYLDEALAAARELRTMGLLMFALFFRGDHAYRVRNYADMVRYFTEAMEVGERVGFRRSQVWSLHHIGYAVYQLGQRERGFRLTNQCLELAEMRGFDEMVAECLATLAGMALDAEEQIIEAAQMLGAYSPLHDRLLIGEIAENAYQHNLPRAREMLGEAAFEAAFRAGQALTLKEAAELARTITSR